MSVQRSDFHFVLLILSVLMHKYYFVMNLLGEEQRERDWQRKRDNSSTPSFRKSALTFHLYLVILSFIVMCFLLMVCQIHRAVVIYATTRSDHSFVDAPRGTHVEIRPVLMWMNARLAWTSAVWTPLAQTLVAPTCVPAWMVFMVTASAAMTSMNVMLPAYTCVTTMLNARTLKVDIRVAALLDLLEMARIVKTWTNVPVAIRLVVRMQSVPTKWEHSNACAWMATLAITWNAQI